MEMKPLRTDGRIERLIAEHKNMVFAIALTKLRNRQDAQDVFQEVFLVYCRKRPFFNDAEHEKAWFISTTLNCAKKAAGTRTKNKTVELTEQNSPVFEFKSSDDTALYEALLSLPEKYRTTLHLFYFEDMSTKEISQALGVREGTVRMHLTRGRDMLKEKLKGAFDIE